MVLFLAGGIRNELQGKVSRRRGELFETKNDNSTTFTAGNMGYFRPTNQSNLYK